jgi:RHS repeat-associated protein
VLQEAFTYFVQAGGGSTVMPIATRTTYPNTTAAGAQTTSYASTFTPGTTQIVSQRTTLPTVTTTQNGPGTAVVTDQVFDAAGREIWSRDGDGFLRYTEYDARTGAVLKSIVDVDTTRTADFQNLPSGWATPAGGGLHLVTTHEVDRLGRITKATDPNGNITFTVYDDVNHSTRTYVGWNTTTGTTTGPITVSRRDLSGTYTESLTYSAAPAVDAQGRPTGTEPITTMQSLTRSLMNAADQVVAVDRYTNLEGLTYSSATATLGLEGVNFLRTRYAYNNQGQLDRVQNPAGTITISTFDGLARLTGTYVGTDDSTTNGFKWTPGNAAATSNMVQVAAYEYDNGGVGNGNLTKATQFPGGGAAPRVMQNAYDWRNRLVATKTGESADLSMEDPSVNRPLSFTDYDNLGRVTGTSVFDGDGVWVIDANADRVPDKPAANLLRSSQISFYDAQDRVYRTQELFVDQATGAVGAPRLTTNMFYDRRGNVATTFAPNAPVMQSRYDGAGRMTASYTLGNVPAATWANATSLTASLILEQTEYTYDAASNVILTTNRERFHDAATTLLGSLGTPASGIPARVSFAASYYDAANRLTGSVNVGTNGGIAYVRPATAPARSDTALVTSYTYDDAGRVQDVTDPRGIVARTLYDALGRTTATIANFTGGAPGSQTDVTALFTFDSAGRLASRTAVQPAGTPSQTTGYVYGISPATGSTITSNDLMAETRYPDPATGLPSATERDSYTSNALGERTSFTDRASTTHTYAYDVTGRQTADAITALGTGVDGAVRRIESGYDVLGRVTSITSFDAPASGNALNQVARVYNGFGQMTNEWQSHTGLVDPATTPPVQYAYSQGVGGNHSRLTQVTYPDGYQVNYAYSGLDSAVSRPTSLTGLRANATTVTLEAFKYLGAGTVIERSRPEINITLSMVNFSGATADAGDKYTGLDRFGRVVDQRWTQGTATTSPVLDRYSHTYDRNSNRLTRSNALAAAFSETYAYDALNQLQSFTRSGGTTTSQQWQFDALGNWTTVTTNGVAQARTANAQNELTQVGSSSLASSTTGNLATDAQGRTLAYDAWNRLVSVKNASDTEVARYEYDGLNRRIVEQFGTLTAPATATAGIRDVYYSQDWQALEERVRTSPSQVAATADTRFIWSPVYVDAMVARDRNADSTATTGTGGLEQRVYAIQDANWNTTAIIAATGVPGTTAGNVINRFVYTPYGESQTLTVSWTTPAVGSSPATPWAHLFQGLKFTDVTGLAYVRNRDYSGTLGRFSEMDPIGFSAGDNNWYRFVANGPTGKVDPSGLEGMILIGGNGIFVTGCNTGLVRTTRPRKDYRPPTNGCSTPWGGDGVFLFTTACNKHDVCYGTCGSDRTVCDKAFLADMVEHCREIHVGLREQYRGQASYNACLWEASAFYRAVRAAGQWWWDAAQAAACEWDQRRCQFSP